MIGFELLVFSVSSQRGEFSIESSLLERAEDIPLKKKIEWKSSKKKAKDAEK
jgi:hypothetical protein